MQQKKEETNQLTLNTQDYIEVKACCITGLPSPDPSPDPDPYFPGHEEGIGAF